MESIKNYTTQPLITGIVGLVIGTLFGLVILGWWLFPVQWTDAGPSDLTYEYQVDYLRMSIDSFAVNGDAALAQSRYSTLGEDADQIYLEIVSNPAGQSTEVIAAYGAVVGAGIAQAPPPAEGTALPTQIPAEVPEEGGGLGSLLPFLCLLFVVFIAGGAGIYIYYTRRIKGAEEAEPMPAAVPPSADATEPGVDVPEEDPPAVEYEASAPPLKQEMTSYKLGDELYDESFSIDSPAGEFLGEFGIGISETIGVGETQKVTAFEIWLFDKNDIQTITKVLMSGHAYQDSDIRQRLAAKGEPVTVSPGSSTVLETQTLYMMARVVDMGYGDGAMPPESYFDRFILELSVWPK